MSAARGNGVWVCLLLLSAMAAMPVHVAAQAEAWPTRPVRLIVPYGAGNVADHVARLLAEDLSKRWGQRVVVDNVPGAGGAIGAAQIARAPADGYTMGLIALAAMAIVPNINKNTPYDPLRDLMPVAGVTISRGFITVRAALPVKTLAELTAYARGRGDANPLLYSSPGNGTVPHLAGAALVKALGFPAQHVPYRTSAASITDMLGGRIDFTLEGLSVAQPHIQSGALRPLAYNGPRRHTARPDVPTVSEAVPGLTLTNAWQSLFAPRGFAPERITRLARDVAEFLATPASIERLPPGTEPFRVGPKELGDQVRLEYERLGQLVTEIGLKAD